jgi:hypothetical protein
MKRRLIATASAILCAALWSAIPASAVTVWRVQQVPVPANASVELQAVSCPAAGVCFAVGYSTQAGTTIESTLAERWSGGRWAILATPSPGIGPVDQLTRLSCLSATDCMAIGGFSTQTGANNLVEHWDGTSWTVLPSPNPVGTTVAGFTGVSCVSTTSCTAVGLYDTSGNRPHELPVTEHWNGANWTVQHVPLPAGVTAGSLSAVSCRSATACIAVGSIATPNQPSNTQPIAEQWNGTSWTVRATPTPAGAYNPGFSDVSCTSHSQCTAVGGYLAKGTIESTLAERWDGTAWTIQSGIAPPGTGLTNVSCTSSVSCTAVGIAGAGTVTPVADYWNGTSWTLHSMPVPHNSTKDVAMFGVSCRSATTCTAVGIYGRTAHPLADHE